LLRYDPATNLDQYPTKHGWWTGIKSFQKGEKKGKKETRRKEETIRKKKEGKNKLTEHTDNLQNRDSTLLAGQSSVSPSDFTSVAGLLRTQ
jgi:hypothetical protein